MEEKVFGSLKIVVQKEDGCILLSMIGKSDDRNPSVFLTPFFEEIVNSVKGTLSVEFKDLEFMNSSTVPPLLLFIKKLEIKKIKSIFYYSKESKWQTASFKALQTIANSLKNISVEAK